MVAGLISLGALGLTDEHTGWMVMLVAVSTAALIPIAMSYFVWRNDPDRETYSADQSGES